MSDEHCYLRQIIDEIVVLDLSSPYVIIGTYKGNDSQYLALEDADVHDLRDSPTTRELYVVETRRLGVRSNRRRVLVRKGDVVGISKLTDVDA